MHGLFDFKCPNSFQKSHAVLPPDVIFKLQQEVLKLNDICVIWSSPQLTW